MYSEDKKMTRAERENLLTDHLPHYSGFTPRPIQKLVVHRQHPSMLKIECSHHLRTSTSDLTHQHPSLEYRLWIEAGKLTNHFSSQENNNYDFNIWRNFRRHFELNPAPNFGTVTETIAALYPLNIPPPSQVGDNTLDKYLSEVELFKSEKEKNLAVKRAALEIQELRRLKCLSEARNPPINKRGDILPPENYKKYAHRFVPIPSPPPLPPPKGQKIDIFGRLYTPRSQPALWKLSHKLNHPRFQKLQKEIKAKQKMVSEQAKVENESDPSVMLPSPFVSYASSNMG